MLPRRPSHPLNQNHAALDVDPIVFELNFPASVVCSISILRRSARRCNNGREFPRRVSTFISSARTPALIHRFNAGF
jgi:hypothetical protein